jgi:hypothetical protein
MRIMEMKGTSLQCVREIESTVVRSIPFTVNALVTLQRVDRIISAWAYDSLTGWTELHYVRNFVQNYMFYQLTLLESKS